MNNAEMELISVFYVDPASTKQPPELSPEAKYLRDLTMRQSSRVRWYPVAAKRLPRILQRFDRTIVVLYWPCPSKGAARRAVGEADPTSAFCSDRIARVRGLRLVVLCPDRSTNEIRKLFTESCG